MTKQEIKAWVRLQNNINMQKTFDNITTDLRPLDREILSRFIIEKDTIKNITEWLNSELGLDLTTFKTSKIIKTIQRYLVALYHDTPHHIRDARKMGMSGTRFVPTTNAPATPHIIVEQKKYIGDICISRTINIKRSKSGYWK